MLKTAEGKKSILSRFAKEREIWILTGLGLVWLVIFFIIPLYGVSYAFFNYTPGQRLSLDRFVGLRNFIQFFKTPGAMSIIRNTLVIGALDHSINFIAPIILALLFNEIRGSSFKRVAQTVSYLPYFISWVVAANLIISLLNYEGLINQVMLKLNMVEQPVPFLTEGRYFWWIITFANMWKGIGWKTILYISAITGVDQELYQAGAADGLGRFGMVWHITLPGIMPTIILLFILGIGGILNAGFEQQLLIGQPTTREFWEVIDTYVYRYGMQLRRYSFAIAVGLLKSVIGLVLVLAANAMAKKVTDISIM